MSVSSDDFGHGCGENARSTRIRKPIERLGMSKGEQGDKGFSVSDPLEIEDDDTTEKSKKRNRPESDEEFTVDQAPKPSKSKITRGPAYMYMDLPKLKKKHQDLLGIVSTTEKANTDLRKKHAKIRKSFLDEGAKCSGLQHELKDVKRQLESLQSRLEQQQKGYEAKLASQKQDFVAANQELTVQIKSNTYVTLPDNEIRDKFKDIMIKCKEWVRTWHSTTPKKLPTDTLSNLLDVSTKGHDPIFESVFHQYLACKGSHAKRMLAHAYLTNILLSKYFGLPFEHLEILGVPAHVCIALYQAYERFQEMNQTKAYAWRADMIRMLRECICTSFSGSSPHTLKPHELQNYALKIAGRILVAFPNGLLRRVTPDQMLERRLTLSEICIDVIRLSVELWSQKSGIRRIGAKELCHTPFRVSSGMYDAHGSMGLDDDDTTVDGHDIQLVLTPGIEAFGNAEGQNLKNAKTWSKAIVLIIPKLTENDLADESHSINKSTVPTSFNSSGDATNGNHGASSSSTPFESILTAGRASDLTKTLTTSIVQQSQTLTEGYITAKDKKLEYLEDHNEVMASKDKGGNATPNKPYILSGGQPTEAEASSDRARLFNVERSEMEHSIPNDQEEQGESQIEKVSKGSKTQVDLFEDWLDQLFEEDVGDEE